MTSFSWMVRESFFELVDSCSIPRGVIHKKTIKLIRIFLLETQHQITYGVSCFEVFNGSKVILGCGTWIFATLIFAYHIKFWSYKSFFSNWYFFDFILRFKRSHMERLQREATVHLRIFSKNTFVIALSLVQ